MYILDRKKREVKVVTSREGKEHLEKVFKEYTERRIREQKKMMP